MRESYLKILSKKLRQVSPASCKKFSQEERMKNQEREYFLLLKLFALFYLAKASKLSVDLLLFAGVWRNLNAFECDAFFATRQKPYNSITYFICHEILNLLRASWSAN